MSPHPSPHLQFDSGRTVVGFHGTSRKAAESLIAGAPFAASQNDDDWLGHGIYLWEYAPRQAWWWARRRYGEQHATVVGAMVRLGRCFDLLDPDNARLLRAAEGRLRADGVSFRENANNHKYKDCDVLNRTMALVAARGLRFDSVRALFVPQQAKRGMPRLWSRSGLLEGTHIQLCLRDAACILSVWPVRADGTYGRDTVSSANSIAL